MRYAVLTTLALAVSSMQAAHADCTSQQVGDLATAGEASLDGMKPLEIEALERRSVEGGVWQIYSEKDGRVHTILRIDGGETVRSETRLSVLNRRAFTIIETAIRYNRNYAGEGPFFNGREDRSFFYFCDGKLVEGVDAEYVKSGNELRDLFLNAKEIAAFTKGFAR